MRAPLELVDAAAPSGDVEHAAAERAEARALCEALAELPPQQRNAVVLREFYGLSYDEAAVALGVSHSALESLLFRARGASRSASARHASPTGRSRCRQR